MVCDTCSNNHRRQQNYGCRLLFSIEDCYYYVKRQNNVKKHFSNGD